MVSKRRVNGSMNQKNKTISNILVNIILLVYTSIFTINDTNYKL